MPGHAPIFEALKGYQEERCLRLHMPGHAGGRGAMCHDFLTFMALDVTEIPGMDDYHLPAGVIAEARRLLARAFGSRESYFLVNGASSGIQALFLSLPAPGCRVLLSRNAHRAALSGLVLSGAVPEYIPCVTHPRLGQALGVTVESVKQAVEKYPDSQAVLITSPGYFGTCSDICRIGAWCQEKGIMLWVDEAHGSHFPFHPAYPESALAAGAQAAVNGLHKSLPVLNQGACLHIGENFDGRERLVNSISLLGTTSPSYPLLASMDLARAFMEQEGKDRLQESLELSAEFKGRIAGIKGLHCYTEAELKKISGVTGVDPLKVWIGVEGLSINGGQLASLLREEYSIQVELSDQQSILAMVSLFHTRRDWELFTRALEKIAARYAGTSRSRPVPPTAPPAQVVLSPREAFFSRKRRIKLDNSTGMLAGEMVAPYPPGIPCLLPGERLTGEMVDYLQYLRRTGVPCHGCHDQELNYLLVIA